MKLISGLYTQMWYDAWYDAWEDTVKRVRYGVFNLVWSRVYDDVEYLANHGPIYDYLHDVGIGELLR